MTTLRCPPYWEEAKTYLSRVDPVLGQVIVSYQGEEGLVNRGDAFGTLIRAIVGQQISVKAADSVWNKLTQAFPIEPAPLVDAEFDSLRACGLSRQKVKYIQGIGAAFHEQTIHPGRWQEWPDDEIMAELVSLPGIGRWTADMFLIFHLLRPDVLPVGDLGLLKGFEKTYRQDREKVENHADIWRPYRTVATWYLWRSLDPVAVAY
jgi:DNA-3-methyladenine glycosylase II